jgi:signal transduction histidine kinase
MRTARRILPVSLLALLLAVGALGAWEAHRSARSHAEAAEAVLRDYGAMAAWRFAAIVNMELGDAIGHSFFPLRRPGREPVRGPLPGPEVVYSEAAHEECGCHIHMEGATAFRFSLRDPHGDFAGHPAPFEPEVERAVVAVVGRHAAATAQAGHADRRFHVVRVAAGGRAAYIAYFLLARADGDVHVYGYELDFGAGRAALAEFVATRELLPPSLTGGRESAEVLAIAVVDGDGDGAGDVLFATDPAPLPALAASAPVSERFGELRVVASIRPELAEQLIIGGLPRSRLPFLLGILLAAALLAGLTLRQFRREDQLARLRSDFVASASHELRTPLAQIRLFLETLRAGRYRTADEHRWFLDTADREAARLTHVVDNVLHFSRLERGAVRAAGVVPDVASLLETTVSAFRPLADARRADLAGRFDAGLAAAIAPDALHQVVLNLLDNAVKYGPEGQTIRLQALRRDEAVEIAVEDEGPGVPPADRARIFEPFRRGSAHVGSAVAGSGIGLSVVRELVRACGGDCRVEDAARGARFVVRLPLARPAATQASAAPAARPAPEPAPEPAPASSAVPATGD